MKSILWPLLASIALISCLFIFFEGLESYFTTLLEQARNNLGKYAFLSFLVLASDIVLPVPSSIVMYGNGLVLGFLKGALISLVAVLFSSTIGYYLGRFTALGLKQGQDEKAEGLLKKYGSFAIILTRGIPVLSESVCLVVGYNRMDFRIFSLLNFLGYLPVCLIYAWFGDLSQNGNLFLISFVASLLVSLALWLFGKKLIERLFAAYA